MLQKQIEIGYVSSVRDYIVTIEGLPSAKINSIISSGKTSKAIVSSLEGDSLQALMLTGSFPKPGDTFQLETEGLRLTVGPSLVGKIINIADLITSQATTNNNDNTVLFTESTITPQQFQPEGLKHRKAIDTQFYSGFTALDITLPLAQGQRELILGDPRSGKTPFLIDLIANQKQAKYLCIYALMGKTQSTVQFIYTKLKEKNALPYTMILSSYAFETAPLISLTPTLAMTIAEYLKREGFSVLVVLDDLGLHAKYLREIALSSRFVPGRDSYPGDIFYQHAFLMEYGGNFQVTKGKKTASITMLPVMEIDALNSLNLISTNLMAMTDGHLVFSSQLSASGVNPPVEILKSVTRVGKQTQVPIARLLNEKLLVLLARYNELKNYTRFGTELNYETKNAIRLGEIATILLLQDEFSYIRPTTQLTLLILLFTDFINGKNASFIKQYKEKLIYGLEHDSRLTALSEGIEAKSFEEAQKTFNNNIALLDDLCR
jgi:F-type H+-transporting ATPase subunit alpha